MYAENVGACMFHWVPSESTSTYTGGSSDPLSTIDQVQTPWFSYLNGSKWCPFHSVTANTESGIGGTCNGIPEFASRCALSNWVPHVIQPAIGQFVIHDLRRIARELPTKHSLGGWPTGSTQQRRPLRDNHSQEPASRPPPDAALC